MTKILNMPTVITGIIAALLIWFIRPDNYCDVEYNNCHQESDNPSSLTGDDSNNGKFRRWRIALPFGINSEIFLHNYGMCVSFNLESFEEQTDCSVEKGNGPNSTNSKECSEMVSPKQQNREMCATNDPYNWFLELLFNVMILFSASTVALKLTNKICSGMHSEDTRALQNCRQRLALKHKKNCSNSILHNKNNNNTNSNNVKRQACSCKK